MSETPKWAEKAAQSAVEELNRDVYMRKGGLNEEAKKYMSELISPVIAKHSPVDELVNTLRSIYAIAAQPPSYTNVIKIDQLALEAIVNVTGSVDVEVKR